MGNIQTLETILIHHLPFLKQVAITYTKDRTTSEDLVQDTIVRILNYQDRFEVGTNFRAWSSTIMRNQFINEYRKKIKRPFVGTFLETESLAGAVSNSGEEQLNYDDLLEQINRLNTIYKEPIIRVVAGYSYQEIADELGVKLGTVKSRIHKARKHLQQWVKGDEVRGLK